MALISGHTPLKAGKEGAGSPVLVGRVLMSPMRRSLESPRERLLGMTGHQGEAASRSKLSEPSEVVWALGVPATPPQVHAMPPSTPAWPHTPQPHPYPLHTEGWKGAGGLHSWWDCPAGQSSALSLIDSLMGVCPITVHIHRLAQVRDQCGTSLGTWYRR